MTDWYRKTIFFRCNWARSICCIFCPIMLVFHFNLKINIKWKYVLPLPTNLIYSWLSTCWSMLGFLGNQAARFKGPLCPLKLDNYNLNSNFPTLCVRTEYKLYQRSYVQGDRNDVKAKYRRVDLWNNCTMDINRPTEIVNFFNEELL
jgi:hypothetical protein